MEWAGLVVACCEILGRQGEALGLQRQLHCRELVGVQGRGLHGSQDTVAGIGQVGEGGGGDGAGQAVATRLHRPLERLELAPFERAAE